jgi:cytohesin
VACAAAVNLDLTWMHHRVRDSKELSPARREKVARMLLEAGANPDVDAYNGSPLHYAAAYGHTATLSVLITGGAQVDIKDGLKRTPLHQAAANGHIEAVRALLAAGADVSWADESWGWLPLHDAAHNGHVEVVRLLLDAGADPLAVDKYGYTARFVSGPMERTRVFPRPDSCDDVARLLESRGG